MNFDDFKGMLALTFKNPAAAANALMTAGIPVPARWMAMVLAVSVSALLAWGSAQIFPMPEGEMNPILAITAQPLLLAAVQLAGLVLASGLMAGVGQMFGGRGRFEDAVLLTVWIEIVLLVVQFGQIVISMVMPAVAGILGILAISLFLWLTVQFTKVLHGFSSGLKVLLGIIGTAFVAGFVLSFMAAAFGLLPEVPQ